MGLETESDWRSEYEQCQLEWLRLMADRVGVAPPGDDAECLALAKEARTYVNERVRAGFPGAAGAVRILHASGHQLYTASGTVSHELDAILRCMGIRDLFQKVCGPDSFNVSKGHARFYEALFAYANVDPRSVVLVDDSPVHLRRAALHGCRTVLVGSAAAASEGVDIVLPRLADLPGRLRELGPTGDTMTG
jgi:HAD superfamily hydrolase (TIGR01509 family)